MVKIDIGNDSYCIPSTWSELSLRELLYLAKLTQQDIPVQQLKLFMLIYHLNGHISRQKKSMGKDYGLRIKRKTYILTHEELNELSALYDFLLTKIENNAGETRLMITPAIEAKIPYPRLIIGLRRLKGPSEYLHNITFEQFMFLQTYLDAMACDPDNINQVIACLYHRNKYWDARYIDRDASQIKKLSDRKKMIIYWFISSCLQSWAIEYPRIFSSSGGGSMQNGVFDSQQRLLNTLANGDITKKITVRASNIMDAFYVIDEALRQKEEAERQAKN